jgi:hypothetical protein
MNLVVCRVGAGIQEKPGVAALAWDADGERLAVAFSDETGGQQRAAVFATTQSPILSMRLLALVAESPPLPAGVNLSNPAEN